MSSLRLSRQTSCPGNVSSHVWTAHPLNMTQRRGLTHALTASVLWKERGRAVVIKAAVTKMSWCTYELKKVWHSSLLTIFHWFYCQFWCFRIEFRTTMMHMSVYFFDGLKVRHCTEEYIIFFNHSSTTTGHGGALCFQIQSQFEISLWFHAWWMEDTHFTISSVQQFVQVACLDSGRFRQT